MGNGAGGGGGGGASPARPSTYQSFNHVSRPPSQSTSGDGRFVTDKPTSDRNYPGQRFMSSNIFGKTTQIYDALGRVIKRK